ISVTLISSTVLRAYVCHRGPRWLRSISAFRFAACLLLSSRSSRWSTAGSTDLLNAKTPRITKAPGAKCCDRKRRAYYFDGLSVSSPGIHGRPCRFCADRVGSHRDHFYTSQRSLDERADLQWHGCRGTAGRALLSSGRRPDYVGKRDDSHDPAFANNGR